MDITRVVIVNESGRLIDTVFDSCRFDYQDDGRTLKIFTTGDGNETRKEMVDGMSKPLIDYEI